jgi:hypothetical protein
MGEMLGRTARGAVRTRQASPRSIWRAVRIICLLGSPVLGSLACQATPASGLLARGHVFAGTFGSTGKAAGQFKEPAAVAVNEATGQLDVLDRGNNRVERFSSSGAFVSQFTGAASPTGKFLEPNAIAIDNSHTANTSEDPSAGDVYVADTGHNVIDKFTSAGAYIGQLTEDSEGAFGTLMGLAVDAAGDLWVEQVREDEEGEEVTELDSFTDAEANEPLSHNLEPELGFERGLAVDSGDNLYLTTECCGITELTRIAEGEASHLKFDRTLGEGRTSGVAFDPASTELYSDEITHVSAFTAAGTPIEQFGAEQVDEGAGIAVNSSTNTVYAADSAANDIVIFTAEPPARPTIDSESASDVSATAAQLHAEVNARGVDTHYVFEYGATEAYGESAPVPAGDIGSAFGDRATSVTITGLLPATTYHYRIVAINELGAAHGEDHTFVTQLPGGFSLPDDRAWELVSPPKKNDAALESIPQEGGIIQASEDGTAVTYLATNPIGEGVHGNAYLFSQMLTRRTPSGWATQDIAVPDSVANGENSGQGNEYRAFSPDLALALVEQRGSDETLLSTEATERTPYIRSDTGESFQPLVTSANVPVGTVFGGMSGSSYVVEAVGMSSDLSHVVLSSLVPLSSTPVPNGKQLYTWAAGHLELASVLPSGAASAGAELGDGNANVRGAVSSNGSRIVWTSRAGSVRHLYLRDVGRHETIQLDENGSPSEGDAVFQVATPDGSKVFFTDGQTLTADSTAGGPEARDLYECEVTEKLGKLACNLKDLTVDNSQSAAVQGVVLGVSDNGAYVYFVANGALAAGASAGDCAEGTKTPQTCNLYVWHEGNVQLVATLSGADRPDWQRGEETSGAQLTRVTSQVSPSGRFLAFMSNRSLTGYDNIDAHSGQPDEEVYLYDAAEGSPVCASCDPSRARPQGRLDLQSTVGGPLVDRAGVWTEHWLAGSLPGWTGMDPERAQYQSRFLSDSGRLFFNSPDALLPQDVNGVEDVYEYERPGVGGCAETSPTFTSSAGGCVSLISSGTSAEESAFLDASTTGDDVFFLTAAPLLPATDVDGSFDVYDAHVCSPARPCPQPTSPQSSCETEAACRGRLTAPAGTSTPATSMPLGGGNLTPNGAPTPRLTRAQRLARALKACRKRHRHRRVECERQARRRYGAVRAHKGKSARGHKASARPRTERPR